MEGALSEMWVVTMTNGDRIIAKDSAVYIPVSERSHMVDTLHLTHASGDSMLMNAKDRVWWPGIRQSLHQKYETCKECALYRVSQQRPTKRQVSRIFLKIIIQTIFCKLILLNTRTRIS